MCVCACVCACACVPYCNGHCWVYKPPTMCMHVCVYHTVMSSVVYADPPQCVCVCVCVHVCVYHTVMAMVVGCAGPP